MDNVVKNIITKAEQNSASTDGMRRRAEIEDRHRVEKSFNTRYKQLLSQLEEAMNYWNKYRLVLETKSPNPYSDKFFNDLKKEIERKKRVFDIGSPHLPSARLFTMSKELTP